jgi:hypothetical protein
MCSYNAREQPEQGHSIHAVGVYPRRIMTAPDENLCALRTVPPYQHVVGQKHTSAEDHKEPASPSGANPATFVPTQSMYQPAENHVMHYDLVSSMAI